METAGIYVSWMNVFDQLARRSSDEREFGLTRFTYEAGPAFGAFVRGLLSIRIDLSEVAWKVTSECVPG